MATENEVGRFLQQFFQKAKTFGLFFRDDRGKNMQALLDLDITPKLRKEAVGGFRLCWRPIGRHPV